MLVSEAKFEGSKFYCEWVTYDSEEEKKEAEIYLRSWIKFTFKKLKDYEIVGKPQFIERTECHSMDCINQVPTLGVKIEFKLKT